MRLLFPLFLCLSMSLVSADTTKTGSNESANTSELEQFRNSTMDILDNPYCRTRFRSYLKLKQPKAFLYVPRKKERTAFCTHVTRKTLDDARQMVINRCARKKKKSRKNPFTSSCRILASNHTLL